MEIAFSWGTENVPDTAWIGWKDGHKLTWFSSQSQGDIALSRYKVDSISPVADMLGKAAREERNRIQLAEYMAARNTR